MIENSKKLIIFKPGIYPLLIQGFYPELDRVMYPGNNIFIN
jgi:hypothetical protein